jgi:hypothetical protein
MLIFILSGLLWQPDYAPRVEIGLPQMSIDATRILAHCFLYELDEFLEKGQADFVRYMDDIDIGVESVDSARTLLRDLDLILHTRQVRLNPGKTLILRSNDAERHFRVRENYIIRYVVQHIDRRIKQNKSLSREQSHIRRVLHKYYRQRKFDDGNGEKILRLLLNISKRIGAKVDDALLNDILRRRPAVRSAAFGVIEWQPLTPRILKLVESFLTSGTVVDEWTCVESADALVHCGARTKPYAERAVRTIVAHFVQRGFFGVYAAIWLLSKYGEPDQIYTVLMKTKGIWQADVWLGRLVGGLRPIFRGTSQDDAFQSLVRAAKNPGAEDVMEFHRMLSTDSRAVEGVRKILMAPNTSKRLGTTHAKFLMLLSVIANESISERYKARYINAHRPAWRDAFYRARARSVVTPQSLGALIKA